jgi:hypothetical protein
MFGKLRRDKTVAPVQGATLAASTRASVDASKLILVHSRGQGSTPAHKALMARALANPPMRTNSILAKGLANGGLANFTRQAPPLANAVIPPTPGFADPAKGEVAWDSTNHR